ncbi:hypothetical protein [Geomesophilobacter sediminis]|uniref:Uncharacterized protein n=1 Tax=Geomesophilobacter sediminis TaxID=2798584 RepID=A0A8J7M476_9BACT|nr:hypothetical protein [Geomesophilobacter sediminis]MBJ6727786.1 hypothetical protein [Geomesophilobacter sediminis]
MRTYDRRRTLRYSAPRESVPEQDVLTPPDDPVARLAWEWNNALRIAADRMWGENGMVGRK